MTTKERRERIKYVAKMKSVLRKIDYGFTVPGGEIEKLVLDHDRLESENAELRARTEKLEAGINEGLEYLVSGRPFRGNHDICIEALKEALTKEEINDV